MLQPYKPSDEYPWSRQNNFSQVSVEPLLHVSTCLKQAVFPNPIATCLRQVGLSINFLISAQKHRLWVLVRTASLRRFYQVPAVYVLSRNMKTTRIFHLNLSVFGVKFSDLNKRIFVMTSVQLDSTLMLNWHFNVVCLLGWFFVFVQGPIMALDKRDIHIAPDKRE